MGAMSAVGSPVAVAAQGDRPRWLGRLVRIAAGVAGFVLLTWLLTTMSWHAFAGNSDGATVVLEGHSIAHGNLILHGWDLSHDSFWSIDAVFYAVFDVVAGIAHAALHVVPALIAACVIAIGAWFVLDEDRHVRGFVGVALLILLLGVPNPDLSFFFLQGPWHVGTALWCLVAFAGLASDRWRAGFAVAVVALVAGLLGDLETLAYGVVPVVLAGLTEMVRRRSWRAGLPALVAGPLATGVAWVINEVLRHNGAFAVANGITHAHASRFPTNALNIVPWLAGIFGFVKLPIGPAPAMSADGLTNGTVLGRWLHLGLYSLVIACVLVALASYLWTTARGMRRTRRSARSVRIDAFLLFGASGSMASFIGLCPNGNADYGRYLVAAAIFLAILCCRVVARTRWDRLPRAAIAVLAAGALVATTGVGIAAAVDLNQAPAPLEAVPLISFLRTHDLSVGIGDYWSSSIVTVASGGAIAVRPVITGPGHRLARYGRQSDAAWYRDVPFQFLVYDVSHPWRSVNATTAIASFGAPKVAYSVGSYRIIVWPHPVQVSTVGFTRG